MCKCTIFLFNFQIFFGKSYFYGEYTSIPYSTTRPTLGTVSNQRWALKMSYYVSHFTTILGETTTFGKINLGETTTFGKINLGIRTIFLNFASLNN